jgi:hypothetical protein
MATPATEAFLAFHRTLVSGGLLTNTSSADAARMLSDGMAILSPDTETGREDADQLDEVFDVIARELGA